MTPTRSDASRNRKRPRTAEVEVDRMTAAPPSKRRDGGGIYVPPYQAGFVGHYAAAHRMTTDELRASARFYAHLLAADALPWRGALGRVRVTEQDTTSSSRIFIKLLFQDLADKLGIRTLSKKMNDDDADVRDVLFPRDCARNTRFAIHFFTAIGLGGVTESARKLIV